MSLEKKVHRLLTSKKKTLSLAESCSGGLLSHRLTNIPGSSKFFKGAVIAYNDSIKTRLLKIPPRTIKKHGAVSLPAAKLMAQNVRKLFKTDLGISITGIAGPTGARKGKPIGLAFIAVSHARKTTCRKFIFSGIRLAVKQQAATQALKLLLKS